MIFPVNDMVRLLFEKQSLHDCPVAFLASQAERYPYSLPHQLLYTKKLKDDGNPDYYTQLEKMQLFIQNQFVLKALLSSPIPKPENIEEDSSPTLSLPGSQLLDIEKKVPVNEATAIVDIEPANEPYHTVDYFASQGITFTHEEKPKDELSQKLKKFTEWLKELKGTKQPEESISEAADLEPVEAESQTPEPMIYTESMATVWIKQGNTQKAVEIFEKLSLLNPEKSAYFAHQIKKIQQ